MLTNPASLLLCDVVIEDGEGSKDDIVGGGAVLAPMTVVFLKQISPGREENMMHILS